MKYNLLCAILMLIVLSFLPVFRNIESQKLTESARSGAPGHFVELFHGDVHYQLQGEIDATVVVFVHGFSVPSYTWERNIPYLIDKGYRVFSYELYGRGYSSRPRVEYNRSIFVTQLEELLKALKIDGKIHIIGLSMGGAIAAAYAAEHPENVQSAAFLAPLNSPAEIGPLALYLVGEYIAYSFFIPQMPEGQLGDFVNPEQYSKWPNRYEEQMKYKGFRYAILATARGFLQSNILAKFESLGNSNIETLLLLGDQDTTLPVEQSDSVRKALGTDNEIKFIENAGHAMHYEFHQELNARIFEFLIKSNSTEGTSETL